MKDVTILITGLGVGGAERFLLKLVPRLDHDIDVISLTQNDELGEELEDCVDVTYYDFGYLNFPFQYRKLKKDLKERDPDVLMTFLVHSDVIGRSIGRSLDAEIISCVRNDYSKVTWFWLLDKLTTEYADLFIANSKALKGYLDKLNVPSWKRRYIPNGIQLDKLEQESEQGKNIREEIGLSEEDNIIISVARLEKQKNLSTLVKSLDHLPQEYKVLLVGDGPKEKELKTLIKEEGLDHRAFLLGYRDDVPSLLRQSNIFVLPSLTEGMSNALLEAMALGLQCVVSDIPQNKALISDGDNGLVFDTRDFKDLAMKIENVKATYGKEAKKTIKEEYTMEKVSKRYGKHI